MVQKIYHNHKKSYSEYCKSRPDYSRKHNKKAARNAKHYINY